MYEELSQFLINLSSGSPLIWAFSVLLVIAGTGLLLYFFWEAVFKGIVALARSQRPSDPGANSGPGRSSG